MSLKMGHLRKGVCTKGIKLLYSNHQVFSHPSFVYTCYNYIFKFSLYSSTKTMLL